MDAIAFKNYLRLFERRVIREGVKIGKLGKGRLIPLRNGRLSGSPYGKKMGNRIPTDAPLAVDYYGYWKKSTGFFDEARESKNQLRGRQLKKIQAPLVHFGQIKIEDVADLAPELVSDFPAFKAAVLAKRGFKKRANAKLRRSNQG